MEKILTIVKSQDVDIINFTFNEINFEQKEQIKKELNELVRAGETKFIIDLSKVGFLSSLVIATIIFFTKEVRKSNGEIKLSGLSNEARSVLQLTQLDKIFELYETENDAVESFKKSP